VRKFSRDGAFVSEANSMASQTTRGDGEGGSDDWAGEGEGPGGK